MNKTEAAASLELTFVCVCVCVCVWWRGCRFKQDIRISYLVCCKIKYNSIRERGLGFLGYGGGNFCIKLEGQGKS